MPGIASPHGCKYFFDGTKLLFHGPLLDRGPDGFQKSGVHALAKDMEERDRVFDTLEVG